MNSEKKLFKTTYNNFRIRSEILSVRLIAILTWVMGLVNLFSAVRPVIIERLEVIDDLFPLEVRIGSRLTTALAGFALMLLANTLWRRKRAGWVLTILLLVISAAAHLIKGLNYEESGMAVLLIVFLLVMHASFYRFSDPPSVKQGVTVLITAFLFTLVYGVAGFTFIGFLTHHPIPLITALRQTFSLEVSSFISTLPPEHGFYKFFPVSVYIIGLATVAFSLFMLIRPVLVRDPSTKEEKERAFKIVSQYGQSTSSFLALFDDKHLFFSSGGSLIAFAVRGHGAIALGDPIGLKEDIAKTITEFKEYCTRNDWQPSFLYILPDDLQTYRDAGFTCLCVAHEAIVSLLTFTLDGSENKPIRNAYNKLTRMGYTTRIYEPPLENDLLEQLRGVSDAWLNNQSGGEKYFIVGSFKDEYIRDNPVIAVHDPEGRIIAFANIIKVFNKSEITIDLMRHQQHLENGSMEFLFSSLALWGKEKGFDSFSLGAVTIFGEQKEEKPSLATRILYLIASLVNRFYRFQGLVAFKDKFHPAWEPRYVAFPGTLALPTTVLTLVRVHSGKNFLWWYLRTASK